MDNLIRHLFIFTFLIIFDAKAYESQIVIIGDSQSYGSFGGRLNKKLKSWKFSTSYYSRPSAIADWFLEGTTPKKGSTSWDAPWGEWEKRKWFNGAITPTISELMKKHKPKLVVIQLGGNMHPYKDEEIKKSAIALMSAIGEGQSSCLWVGPPPGEKRPEPRFSEFYVLLKEVVEAQGCKFLDSRKVIVPAPKGGDGIHLDTMKDGEVASKKWTDAVANEIFNLLNDRKS